MPIFVPDFDGALLHEVVHSREYSCPIFLCCDLSVCVEAEGVVYLPHRPLMQSIQHVRGSPNVSSVLLASAEEVDIQLEGLLQLSPFPSDEYSLDAFFPTAPEIASVFPSTKGYSQFPVEKLPKGLVNETPLDRAHFFGVKPQSFIVGERLILEGFILYLHVHDYFLSLLPLFLHNLVLPPLEVAAHFVCIQLDEPVIDFGYHGPLVVLVDRTPLVKIGKESLTEHSRDNNSSSISILT